ncbi:MAG: sulfotransferase domain-containing protein [Candidatus Magnetoovum sp. WYHC-5]|nr:sulfotransferase domain-containing protein [Candidatus Magnetoovum sp. WYHC-5]
MLIEKVKTVLHCSPHKAGSQWIKSIVKDPLFTQITGYQYFDYVSTLPDKVDYRHIMERYFERPLPEYSIVSTLFIGYDNYKKLPGVGPFRAFYVLRDPRDVLVSYFFSQKYSHPLNPKVQSFRQQLKDVDVFDGLNISLKRLLDCGTYDAMKSWMVSAKDDNTVLLVRFEDLIGADKCLFFKKIFDHCGFTLSNDIVCALLAKYSFSNLTKEREQGIEDCHHHYRKGVAGDWKNYFNHEMASIFMEKTGALLSILGYEEFEND